MISSQLQIFIILNQCCFFLSWRKCQKIHAAVIKSAANIDQWLLLILGAYNKRKTVTQSCFAVMEICLKTMFQRMRINRGSTATKITLLNMFLYTTGMFLIQNFQLEYMWLKTTKLSNKTRSNTVGAAILWASVQRKWHKNGSMHISFLKKTQKIYLSHILVCPLQLRWRNGRSLSATWWTVNVSFSSTICSWTSSSRIGVRLMSLTH